MNDRVLFMHVPMNYSKEKSFIQAAPLGLIGLADYVERKTNSYVQICHLSSLLAKGKYKNVIEFLEDKSFNIIALNLHWHYQSYDVIEVCKQIKTMKNPPIILLGGYTATWYANEILQKFQCVDYIIKGDGEEPIVKLIGALNGINDFAEVDNLVWRSNGEIISNPMKFVANSEFLNNVIDWNLSLYKDDSSYRGYISSSHALDENKFFLPIGRGCSLSCSYCAGSKENQKISYHRNRVVYRSPERVFQTIKEVVKQGISDFYVCFAPPEIKYEWYEALFNMIKKSKLDISMCFECYDLPDEKFVEIFYETFNLKKSELIFSPNTFDDELRKVYTSQTYNRSDLEMIIKKCESMGGISSVYFTIFPNNEDSEWDSFFRKVEWMNKLKSNLTSVAIMPIHMEPGSPWFINEDKFNIRKTLNSFEDFYIHHSKPVDYKDLGYDFEKYKEKLIYYNSIDSSFLNEIDLTQNQTFKGLRIVEFKSEKELRKNYNTLLGFNDELKIVVFMNEDLDEINFIKLIGDMAGKIPNLYAIKCKSYVNNKNIIDVEVFFKNVKFEEGDANKIGYIILNNNLITETMIIRQSNNYYENGFESNSYNTLGDKDKCLWIVEIYNKYSGLFKEISSKKQYNELKILHGFNMNKNIIFFVGVKEEKNEYIIYNSKKCKINTVNKNLYNLLYLYLNDEIQFDKYVHKVYGVDFKHKSELINKLNLIVS